MTRRAFTLIELLIVVAIIAILAAIALPNFLEAQVRAKVARVKSDERSLATALEAYHVDQNVYPDIFANLLVLTSPVAYVTTLFPDVFREKHPGAPPPFAMFITFYGYGAMPIDDASRYILQSVGPDTDFDTYLNGVPDGAALRFYPGYSPELFTPAGVPVNAATFSYINYDPTNGTISSGDIFRPGDHSGQ